MAEGGHHLQCSGSECIYDFYCELCDEDGKHIEAHGYCANCKDYLCEECYHGHTKTRSSRHHVLLDKTNMPKDTPLPSDRVSKMINTMCKSHPEKVVKFYCKSDEVFGCSTCFVTEHRSCPDVENILEKSENILESQEYTSFESKLKSMMKQSEDMLKLSSENKILIRTRCLDAVCSLRQVKAEVVLILEEIESNIIEKAEKLSSECDEQMENLTKEFSAMSQRINAINSEVEGLFSSKRVCQLYIKMKEAEKDVVSLQESLKNAEKKNVRKLFTFKPNTELKGYLNRPDILGKISYQDEGARNISLHPRNEPSKTTATQFADINARSSDQTFTCDITGSAVLSNTRMILTDFQNNKVKLVDSISNTVISELLVKSDPRDVAALSSTKAAVTLSETKKILLLRVADKLSIERSLAVRGECGGIAYSQDKLFVTFIDNPRVDIIDMHGNVLRTIEHDGDGRTLFERPNYVCLSPDGKSIYVSDYIRHTVTSLTFDGIVMSVYTDMELKAPHKVCTDHHGNVYVCGGENRNVHMITADCKKVKVILTRADRLYGDVYSVSYCQDTRRLFIGMEKHNKVKVFQLS